MIEEATKPARGWLPAEGSLSATPGVIGTALAPQDWAEMLLM